MQFHHRFWRWWMNVSTIRRHVGVRGLFTASSRRFFNLHHQRLCLHQQVRTFFNFKHSPGSQLLPKFCSHRQYFMTFSYCSEQVSCELVTTAADMQQLRHTPPPPRGSRCCSPPPCQLVVSAQTRRATSRTQRRWRQRTSWCARFRRRLRERLRLASLPTRWRHKLIPCTVTPSSITCWKTANNPRTVTCWIRYVLLIFNYSKLSVTLNVLVKGSCMSTVGCFLFLVLY